jgi:serine/threonine-protein kinase
MRNAPYQVSPDREHEALTFGRYELTRKLSQGGMAEIYLARQSGIENFEKQVVVKIVLPTLAADDDYEDMLLNEARMAARLTHPNIVQILDLGKLDGRFFIAMEYLEGENLLSIIQRTIKSSYALPLGFICRVIADVLSGLDYAQAQVGSDGRTLGIIHRDISPPNVIVTYAGCVKVVDFGIAKATRSMSQSVTQAGQFKGKLSYMSPEQVRRQALDARTDIFSTGVLLWELVTRKRLFRRSSDIETMRAVLDHEVPPPSTLNPDCPPELDQIVARALERSVQERYPTARAMRQQLEELIREKAWPADSLSMHRVMVELFGEQPRGATVTAAPEESTVRPEDVIAVELVDPLAENDPTQRTPKSLMAELEQLPASSPTPSTSRPASVEVTVALAPKSERQQQTAPAAGDGATSRPAPPRTIRVGAQTIDHMLTMRRRWQLALATTAGVALFAAGMLVSSLGHKRQAAPPPAVIATPAKLTASAPPPDKVVATSKPTRARIEVRIDTKSLLTLDGQPIEPSVPVEIDAAARHVLAVQRVGHHTVRTLELPRVEPGQHLVLALYTHGLPDSARADEPAAQDGEAGATTARGPVVEAIMH